MGAQLAPDPCQMQSTSSWFARAVFRRGGRVILLVFSVDLIFQVSFEDNLVQRTLLQNPCSGIVLRRLERTDADFLPDND